MEERVKDIGGEGQRHWRRGSETFEERVRDIGGEGKRHWRRG